MYLTTEGVFGVPLGVSAGFVFLFVLLVHFWIKQGAGEYFINLAYALLGKFRGGYAKATVVASGFTGIMSGVRLQILLQQEHLQFLLWKNRI